MPATTGITATSAAADRIIRVSGRGGLAREITDLAGELPLADREPLIEAMLLAAGRHQMVREFAAGPLLGWKLAPGALRLVAGDGQPKRGQDNRFFAGLYSDVAARLASPGSMPLAFEAREHTAQVDALVRELRECRFRFGDSDKERIAEISSEAKPLPHGGQKLLFGCLGRLLEQFPAAQHRSGSTLRLNVLSRSTTVPIGDRLQQRVQESRVQLDVIIFDISGNQRCDKRQEPFRHHVAPGLVKMMTPDEFCHQHAAKAVVLRCPRFEASLYCSPSKPSVPILRPLCSLRSSDSCRSASMSASPSSFASGFIRVSATIERARQSSGAAAKLHDLGVKRDHAPTALVLLAAINAIFGAHIIVLDHDAGGHIVNVHLVGAQPADLVDGSVCIIKQQRQPVGRIVIDLAACIFIKALQVPAAARPDWCGEQAFHVLDGPHRARSLG